ncbi:hypothetical protein [Mycobacterium spongiae]|uniref:hypothetical protein n=1 Tax=Mycobacterium spongiae TaxID=886343 RepID=UPI001FE7C208|nr:hypothetical protein [Mycobacterium spongiae]
MIAAGCGSNSTEPAATSQSQTTSDESSPTTATGDVEGFDCPTETAVTVSSTNGAYPDGLDWSTVYAVADRPLAGLGGDGRAVVVYIGTSERPLSELTDPKTELNPDEAFLKLTFTDGARSADSGNYSTAANPSDPNTVDLSIRVTGRTTVQLSQPTGEAQLVNNTNAVCGTFTLADQWTEASGAFLADIST